MLNTTLPRLICPRCQCALARSGQSESLTKGVQEIRSGQLTCEFCQARYPILQGVALLVEDVGSYLMEHVKGISQVVPDSEIPKEFRRHYQDAKADIQSEHIEEDLEAERVNALYLMNHYLRVDALGAEAAWWQPRHGAGSPVIDALVREHWDRGPFATIEKWVSTRSGRQRRHAVELGCGVGGLSARLKPCLSSYLGVDSSFASIALARHLALGTPYSRALRIPEDLLHGPVAREIRIPVPASFDGSVDFVVGDLVSPPLQAGVWDFAIALNTIDMLDEPAGLPAMQNDLLVEGGFAIQSCPYIWHEKVASALRKRLPASVRDSASAVEWLYEKAGFEIEERSENVPWLFFKHVRQLEVYSVHAFAAKKR